MEQGNRPVDNLPLPPPPPTIKIIAVASIAAGVQFGWALQLSLLTPYVQQLGVPHMWASFIWLCGPFSGLIVQPIAGYWSDNTTSKLGRRRPFILVGAAFVSVAVILVGFAADIGHYLGDRLDKPVKPRAVAFFVLGFWLLDVANNTLQGPCRALLADLSGSNHRCMRIANSCFSFFMAVGNILGYAAGSLPRLYKILPFTATAACDVYCANLKSCFLIDVVLLIAIVSIATTTVKEIPMPSKKKELDVNEPTIPFRKRLSSAFKGLNKPMWLLYMVTAFNWVGWFPWILYDTDWMGLEVYGGKAQGSATQISLYDKGVHVGSLGLMLNSVALAVASTIVEPLSKVVGGVKRWWGIVNFILALSLLLTIPVTKAAEAHRAIHGLVKPPDGVRTSALAIFTVLGIPLSVTYSIPFALASIFSSTVGGGQGLSLGLLNLSIVIPQMIVSLVSGWLDKQFGGGGNMPGFIMGAIAAFISGIMAIFVLPDPPSDSMSSNFIAGGGH